MKALKAIALIVGPLALIFGIYWFVTSGNKSPLSDSVTMVDVTNGEIVYKERSKIASVPAMNKDGQFVYFRAEKRDDGKWMVIERDQTELVRIDGENPGLVTHVDMETFLVK